MAHYTEDELTLYHYGEVRRRDRVEQHLQECESCAATYRDIARTLTLVGDLEVPERDERYGLEMWQRIRHDLPPQEVPWFMGLMAWHRFALPGEGAIGQRQLHAGVAQREARVVTGIDGWHRFEAGGELERLALLGVRAGIAATGWRPGD